MSYRTVILDHDGLTEIGSYGSLQEAVDDTREMWMEDSDPCLIVVETWPGRVPVATMARDGGDPEVCITCYLREFAMEVHRCHYVLGEETGLYLRTEVTEIEHSPAE